MMESCLNYKPERVGSVPVEDLRKDLSAEFSKISESRDSLGKEHLRVYLRVRPFTAAERAERLTQGCVSVDPPDGVSLTAPRASLTARHSDRPGAHLTQRFQFSRVYGPETTQRQIFDGTTKCLVKDVLEGGNSLIFTYGVTNAGKTFTFLGPESDGGILPRSLNVIFNTIEDRIYLQNNIKPLRCVDFTRLTKEQQEEEATNKRILLRRFKDTDSQKTTSSLSSSSSSLESSTSSDMSADSVSLDEDSYVKFSVWVSFCEIYNEYVHDLLDFVPNGNSRRSVLRLAQDVKGNTFVKDLKWVQVNSADEAFKVVKIGRKNQTFSSTKLNNISSRSHSIFSIRILRIEDVGVPRVHTISELSLCDLAGSERCAKTQNSGDRLKEAGNINTSLLTLGKCINALRLNQTQSKFHQHIPFRESKLTHYLQGFFSGHGKVCMIININQCASMYDETLNVLRFSAVAQKVVVLNPKPAPSLVLKRSARDVSMIINNADRKDWTRRSSLMGWDMSLEDVQEDKDDEETSEEEVESEEEESMEEDTVLEAAESQELQVEIEELKEKLSKAESQIREEVTAEFMELFSNMEKDHNERLQREKEIVEERAERRLDILKNLVNKTVGELTAVSADESAAKEATIEVLDNMIEAMREDLAKIKGDAEAVQMCLTSVPDPLGTVNHLKAQLEETTEELHKSQELFNLKTKEMEAVHAQLQESHDQLLEANKNYENQKMRSQDLMLICQEKDDMISKLQTALDQNVEATTKDRALIDTIKEEILHFRNHCKCVLNDDSVLAGEEMRAQEIQQLQQDLKMKEDQLNELKLEKSSLEKKMCDLADRLAEQTRTHDAAVSTLETERSEVTRVTNENKALAGELHLLQQAADDTSSKLRTIQKELSLQTKMTSEISEELDAAKSLIKEHQTESSAQSKTIESLMAEADRLKMKEDQLNELKLEKSSLEKKMCDLADRLAEQTRTHDAAVSSLETERSEVTRVTNENKALADELHLLQQTADNTSSKLRTIQKDLSLQTKMTSEISEELDAAKSLIKEHQTESSAQSKTIESLMAEADRLRQDLNSNQLSYDRAEALRLECERMEEESQDKSRQIDELEQEVSQTRAKMSQLEELSNQLRSERDAQIQAYQALQSRYEAENLAEAQRRNSELLKELTALMQQQGRLKEQEQDSRDDCWITLKEQLMQTMRKLNQQEEVLNVVRVIVENEISKVRYEAQKKVNEMEKDLAHKDAELENKAQELLKSRELVNDGLNKIKTMSCDLQQVERERSNLRNQLSEAKVQIEHSQKQILSLSEENKLLQQRLCRAEEMRDQTMHSLSCKQETIDPLQTWQSNYAREENIQLCQKACQDLSAKQMLIEEMRVNATKKESTQTDREQLVGAGPNKRASINEDPAKLQGMQRNGRADDQRQQVEQRPCKPAESTKRANEELASDKQEREQGEGLVGAAGREAREAEAAERLQGGHHDRLQLELETLQKQLAEKQDTIINLQREKDELASSIKSAIQREEDRLQASDVKMNNEGDSSCPTQEDVTILDSSVISTKSLRDERFPKPELEISFTPLKPDRMNIRRPGDQGSVTVKLRRTARKRKSPETENSAESENRKNRRLKVNNSINVQPVETPTVQNKRVSQLKQQESAGSLRGRRDGALQKIGDFIQSSPTPFGSKAKKIMSIVNSPEPQSIYENIKPKRSKRKLFKAQISSPFDMPSHPIIGSVEDDKESDHLIIKRKLRTRTAKIIQHF